MPAEAPWAPDAILITCEHAGREVPPEQAPAFSGAEGALSTHRGMDIGALDAALAMADALAAPVLFSTTTRLLVDLNRSIDNENLFSEFTRGLSEAERASILERSYWPFRREAERTIGDMIDAGRRVLHVSMHSFVDVLDGSCRDLDVGLLFDPGRSSEVECVEHWRAGIASVAPTLRIDFNRPYLGVDDGHTTALRRRFPQERYAGLEIELRQGLVGTPSAARELGRLLGATLGPMRAPLWAC